MRIAIYNRWLHTLGGGERDTALFAEVLQLDHQVDLLTHQPIDIAQFALRLNRRLDRVQIRTLPLDPDYEYVAAASAEYDLFLHASHGDMLIPRARHNLMRVFFPERLADDGPTSDRLTLLSGFYRPEDAQGRTFAWTGHRAQAQVHVPASRWSRWLPRRLHILVHGWRPPEAEPASLRVAVNGTPLAERQLPRDGTWTDWRIPLPTTLAQQCDLLIELESSTFNPIQAGIDGENRDLGVAVAYMQVERVGVPSQDRAKDIPDDIAYHAMLQRRIGPSVAAYDRLLANSQFTQRWIERRWHRSSEIVYPLVDGAEYDPAQKVQQIVSVGRFFPGSHNKKHLPMIEAFRALCDAGLQGWEYHLVGGCATEEPEHLAYLQQVRAAAEGYPIVFHVNAPFAMVRDLYQESTIFWHATGFGEDEERDPEVFEHLGITTVEAMAAGCVPVVYGAAGQLEIVEHGVDGFLWRTLPKLQSQTRLVIDQAAQRARWTEAALRRSREFAPERFAQTVRDIVDSLR